MVLKPLELLCGKDMDGRVWNSGGILMAVWKDRCAAKVRECLGSWEFSQKKRSQNWPRGPSSYLLAKTVVVSLYWELVRNWILKQWTNEFGEQISKHNNFKPMAWLLFRTIKINQRNLHFSEGYVFIGPQTLLITFLLSISRAGYSCLSNLLLNRPPWFQQ